MEKRTLEKNLDRLDLIHQITRKRNWNLYGALPISDKIFDNVRLMLFHLDEQPEIYPTGCEAIQLEYENDSRYLCFEVYENKMEVFVEYNSKEIIDNTVPLQESIDTINDICKTYK